MRLAAFTGIWRVERAIEDARDGRTGRFTGEARFAPEGEGLGYVEEGMLAFGDAAPLRASRRYLWSDGGAGTIEVRFADGRFFHRFDAEDLTPAASHACAPDIYRVRYDFRGWPRWRAEWRVEGPNKDYRMATEYARAGGRFASAGAPV